jgi:hypothetical protein
MPRQNPDGSTGKAPRAQEKADRWSAIKGGDLPDQFPFGQLDPVTLRDMVACVLGVGSSVTISTTRDGSGLGLRLYDGRQSHVIWVNGLDDFVTMARRIMLLAED